MKKDKHKTTVKFLIEQTPSIDRISNIEQVFAFFYKDKNHVQFKTNRTPDEIFTCYSHVGQHSNCHVNYANKCRLATPEEYKNLKEELESLGYNLDIYVPENLLKDLFEEQEPEQMPDSKENDDFLNRMEDIDNGNQRQFD